MNQSFRGRFELKLDPKGRLSLPPSLRQALPNGLAQIVITNSRYQNSSCLHAYSLSEWQSLERRIAKLPALNAQVQAFQRFYLSGGQVIDVDAQNRVLIPQSLRRFAALESQIVVVGLGAKFEIWAENSWRTIFENLSENFEDTMSAVAHLETGEEQG
ncbi:MAG: division/cell wall cluster transcriptional repressor MraZ [Bdellovibrionaceae bacterium]|nr:division/cell wall cluster transcriptional repressor MraZ [Pseudobdellovibrionaceae bacterium]